MTLMFDFYDKSNPDKMKVLDVFAIVMKYVYEHPNRGAKPLDKDDYTIIAKMIKNDINQTYRIDEIERMQYDAGTNYTEEAQKIVAVFEKELARKNNSRLRS